MVHGQTTFFIGSRRWGRGLSLFRVSYVGQPAHFYELPVLQNDLVDNFSADNTFPSPEVLMGAIKFIINHDTVTAKTLHREVFPRSEVWINYT